MKIGFDVDGTLCTDKFSAFHMLANGDMEKLNDSLKLMLGFAPSPTFDILRKCIELGYEVYIISFRWKEWEYYTIEWLRRHGIDLSKVTLEFAPPEITTNCPQEYERVVVKYKADLINKYQLDFYFEDTNFIVDALKTACPKTLICHVVND